MTEQEPQSEDIRAAEYVLGTLDAPQRAQVDAALARGDRKVIREVCAWEQHLGKLGLDLPPVPPPAHVWSRLAMVTQGAAQRRGRVFWPALAMAASVAALAMAAALYLGLPQAPSVSVAPPRFASLIRDKSSGAGWLLTGAASNSAVRIAALEHYSVPAGKSLELWLLPPGGKPVALGLLPKHGIRNVRVPAGAKLSAAAKFAVSLEPAGGSPTGKPTGKILWTAPLTGIRG